MDTIVSSPASCAESVPMSGPDIGELEIRSVVEALRSGVLSIGPRLQEFERSVARLADSAHGVGVSSGTAGLHLAIIAAGVESGDVVVTTPFSFVASANCVLYERALPVFVDVDLATGNIDPMLAAEAIGDLANGGAARRRWLPPTVSADDVRGVKAVLPVHAFGHPADADPIVQAARNHGLAVIEDACEAIGSSYKGRPVGSLGDAAVFAFYPNKQVTTGEGGMIVSNRADWAARCRSMRNQGRDSMDAWLTHDRLGYNYRLDELSAALGQAQVSRLQELVRNRERVAGWYHERLHELSAIEVPAVQPYASYVSWFAYVIRLASDIDRRRLMAALAAQGIPSRPYFSPIHLQAFYRDRFGYEPGSFPVAEALGDCCLALPFSGTLTEAHVDRVSEALTLLVAAGSWV